MLAEGHRFGRRSNARDGAGKQSAAESAAATPSAARWSRAWRGELDGRRALTGTAETAAASAGHLIDERQSNFDFAVFGECLRARHVDGAARAIHSIGTGDQRVACAVAV